MDILGRAGSENVQGEDQQKLDIYANETFLSELKASGECCGVASEENQDIIVFDDGLSRDAKYIFCMDPLDGSSNIDVNLYRYYFFCLPPQISAGRSCEYR